MFPNFSFERERGASLVELGVAIALIVIALTSLFGLAAAALQISWNAERIAQAHVLGKEMLEATRSIRDGTEWNTDGLGTLSLGTEYHSAITGGSPASWEFVSGTETIGEFTRYLLFEEVRRDGGDTIVTDGSGFVDDETLKVTAVVEWEERTISRSLAIPMYITNWREAE